MGCNFYLKKVSNDVWNIPGNLLGDNLERVCKQQFEDNEKNIVLNLSHCIKQVNKLHIGKSSMGWHFSLCIYPTLNIYSLKDWINLFNNKDEYIIVSEDDDVIEPSEMVDRIANREAISFKNFSNIEDYEKFIVENTNNLDVALGVDKEPYKTYEDLLKDNHATRGKNGLFAHSSNIWDMREQDVWKNFIPMISVYIPTDGTYDLTTQWDFS